MEREKLLLRRIRWLTGFFVFGLVISGVTAIPLVTELNGLSALTGAGQSCCCDNMPVLLVWLETIRTALVETQGKYPFLFYGTDWLAFGHIMIAISFLGVLRQPVRNKWLFDFGLIACALVVPWAFGFGTLRGIPWWWRLIDCSFGVFGAVPLWWCRKWVCELETLQGGTK